jgi:hypothetical protein
LHIAILILHRLPPVVAEVYDAETAVAEGDSVGCINTVLIRTAMRDGIIHFRNKIFVIPGKSANTAHVVIL